MIVEQESDTQYLTLGRNTTVIPAGQGSVKPSLNPSLAGRIIGLRRIHVKWLRVPKAAVASTSVNPSLANPWLDTCLGTVNSAILFGWAGAGRMLLESVKLTPDTSVFGDRTYDIELNWHFSPNGWNYVWWPDAARQGYNNGFVLIQVGLVSDVALSDTDTSTANKGKRLYDPQPHQNIFLAAT